MARRLGDEREPHGACRVGGSGERVCLAKGMSPLARGSRTIPVVTEALDDAAVRSQWRQVARRIEEPKAFPLVDDHSQVLTGEQQLLHTPFGASGVDRNEAPDRSGKTNGEQSKLQDATHREFLHERLRGMLGLNIWWTRIAESSARLRAYGFS